MTDNEKIILKKTGIISGIILFVLILMFLLTFFSRNFWVKGLKTAVGQCLEQNFPENYEILSPLKINSAFSTSAKAFEVVNKSSGKSETAVIINITTLYGPFPAVFIADGDNVEFVDYLCMPEGFSELVTSISLQSTVLYWKNRIPSILNLGGIKNE